MDSEYYPEVSPAGVLVGMVIKLSGQVAITNYVCGPELYLKASLSLTQLAYMSHIIIICWPIICDKLR